MEETEDIGSHYYTVDQLEFADTLKPTDVIEVIQNNENKKVTFANLKKNMGPQGPSTYAAAVDAGFVGTVQQWLNSLVGPIGAQGVTGDKGPVGLKGDPGLQGIVGPKGSVGLAGNTGPIGDKGIIGETGYEGPQGPDGAVGADGVPGGIGTPGITGNRGIAGVDGKTGPGGAVGPQGPKGLDGASGVAGAQGPKGPDGDPGPAGPKGPDAPVVPAGDPNRIWYFPYMPYNPSDVGKNGDTWIDTETQTFWKKENDMWVAQMSLQEPSPSGFLKFDKRLESSGSGTSVYGKSIPFMINGLGYDVKAFFVKPNSIVRFRGIMVFSRLAEWRVYEWSEETGDVVTYRKEHESRSWTVDITVAINSNNELDYYVNNTRPDLDNQGGENSVLPGKLEIEVYGGSVPTVEEVEKYGVPAYYSAVFFNLEFGGFGGTVYIREPGNVAGHLEYSYSNTEKLVEDYNGWTSGWY